MNAKNKLIALQYLRAIAALGVVVFHTFDRQNMHVLGDIGAAGVDIFFVISGFIMWWITAAKPHTPYRFIMDRITRIVPLYWVCTFGLCTAAIMLPSAFPRLRLDGDHLLLSLFFIPHYSPSDDTLFPLFAAGWTLHYEMFFYVSFAGLLIFSDRSRFTLILSIFFALVTAGLFYKGRNPLILTYTNVSLLEFAAGVALGRLRQLSIVPRSSAGLALVIAGLCGFSAAAIYPPLPEYRIFFWGIPAFLLVAGAISYEFHGRVPSSPTFESIGDASYSIYLSHGVVLAALAKFWPASISFPSAAAFTVAGIAISVLAGWLCYMWIERPLIAIFRSPRAAKPALLPST